MNRADFIRMLSLSVAGAGFGCSGDSGVDDTGAADIPGATNPFLDRAPEVASRDPALHFHDGIFRCFHTAVDDGVLYVDVVRSRDLAAWSEPRRLTGPGLNFSSPGNVVRDGDRWLLCVQSYPIPPGHRYGSEDSRLWLMESPDLEDWSEPWQINPEGCRGAWTDSRRQIDPYLVSWQGRWWCFYKTSGSLGLLVSDDLRRWSEAAPARPVISREMTPDGATVENPCIVRRGGEFVMFFARVGKERGVGVARSRNLTDWRDVRYLEFPELSWADSGPTAAMVLDLRASRGWWLMAFHGERTDDVHGRAALGLAVSDDLERWRLPGG